MSEEIRTMFASIAHRYDLANDVLSCGLHRLWRRRMLRALPAGTRSVLDLCTGTGDVAFALRARLGPSATVIGVDFVNEMVRLAAQKQRKRPGRPPILFVNGDALHIPLPDNSMEAVTISFGIRNVDDVSLCLGEIRRVLVPGGRLLILEFGQITVPVARSIYDWYGRRIMPQIGKLLTGNKRAYEYLPETALRFPAGAAFTRLLCEAGYEQAAADPLLGGLAYIYSGLSSPSATASDYARAAA